MREQNSDAAAGNFKALVDGEVAEYVAVSGENVHVMLDDIGFAMVR